MINGGKERKTNQTSQPGGREDGRRGGRPAFGGRHVVNQEYLKVTVVRWIEWMTPSVSIRGYHIPPLLRLESAGRGKNTVARGLQREEPRNTRWGRFLVIYCFLVGYAHGIVVCSVYPGCTFPGKLFLGRGRTRAAVRTWASPSPSF